MGSERCGLVCAGPRLHAIVPTDKNRLVNVNAQSNNHSEPGSKHPATPLHAAEPASSTTINRPKP